MSFSIVMLHVCKLPCPTSSRILGASERDSTQGAVLGVFCTGNLCLSPYPPKTLTLVGLVRDWLLLYWHKEVLLLRLSF